MKYPDEEWPEMIKHLGDEVPPHPDVGRQVRDTDTMGRSVQDRAEALSEQTHIVPHDLDIQVHPAMA